MGNFKEILQRALNGTTLQESEIVRLISATSTEEDFLFAAAKEVRQRHFGDEVFLYGFIYLSTYCRNNCHFCSYRIKSTEAIRYRKNEDEILQAATDLSEQGVHLLDLTMGEDPEILTPSGMEWLNGLLSKIKNNFKLPIMVSPGVVAKKYLSDLKKSGADWFACYQETHDLDLFQKLRVNQSFDERNQARLEAKEVGFLVEDGLLCGVGETPKLLADSVLKIIKNNKLDQIRAMGFVPPVDALCPSPLPGVASQREIIMIAVLRLIFPDLLIPASLDVDGLAGLAKRLNAGANVITSIIPTGLGLAGVAQATLDIDNKKRTVSGVLSVLPEVGLKVAEQKKYNDWINKRL